ncbi:MAG: 50S ribosomal protein L19 [Phycisphaerales bacterium]|nr:50S ribosomal protein L19 [Phycisphaerales bacterium]
MGIQDILASLNADIIKKDLPVLDVGDTINVHCRIVEGDKERIQVFSGVLISRSKGGISEMIVVRRMVEGVGVERIFPINSPRIAMFEVVRRGDARRAKLYYLRDRKGKSQRLRDRRRGAKHIVGQKLAGHGG